MIYTDSVKSPNGATSDEGTESAWLLVLSASAQSQEWAQFVISHY
jgi:hypothetical protein